MGKKNDNAGTHLLHNRDHHSCFAFTYLYTDRHKSMHACFCLCAYMYVHEEPIVKSRAREELDSNLEIGKVLKRCKVLQNSQHWSIISCQSVDF